MISDEKITHILFYLNKKKDKERYIINLRSIAILNIFTKLIESIILIRIINKIN